MSRKNNGLSIMELLIAIFLLSVIVIGLSSIEMFSHFHLLTSDKRAKLQNEVSYALEHMSKYVMQGMGNQAQDANKPLEIHTGNDGFRVRVDPRPPDTQTPLDLDDDLWYNYILSGNTLSYTCDQITGASPACPPNEILARHIISGVALTQMPADPASGYYIYFTDTTNNSRTSVEVGLAARYIPGAAASPENPQVEMKTIMQTRTSSSR